MTGTNSANDDVLVPGADLHYIDVREAKALFTSFFRDGFSYRVAADAADSFSYASAKTMVAFLPDMIEGYLKNGRKDFIVYKIISALDPSSKYEADVARAKLIRDASDTRLKTLVGKLLEELRDDPPTEIETLDRIREYWTGLPSR